MIERLIAGAIFAVILACAYVASVKWQEDKHPLLITAGCTAGPNPCAKIDCGKQVRERETRKWA